MDEVSPVLYQRIAALEAQVAFLYQHLSIVPPPIAQFRSAGIPPELIARVRAGDKIGAIKLHRELFGSSLLEAKTVIEGLG